MERNRQHSLLVAAFPILLTLGILLIPVVSDYGNHDLAQQAVRQTGRWLWGHLIAAAAFGVGTLAAAYIAVELDRRSERLGRIGLPLIAIGAALYAAGLGADGIGAVATHTYNGNSRAFFDGSGMMVAGVFIAASVLFGAGLILQTVGAQRSGLVTGAFRYLVGFAAIAFMGAGAIPSGWGLYLVAASAMLVYLPISVGMRREHSTSP
ncbi:MAG: hypothetical protein PVJ07_00895 [Anaerolineales bacterium]